MHTATKRATARIAILVAGGALILGACTSPAATAAPASDEMMDHSPGASDEMMDHSPGASDEMMEESPSTP
jgi:hypothetical protein